MATDALEVLGRVLIDLHIVPQGGKPVNVTIHDVLYMPEIAFN